VFLPDGKGGGTWSVAPERATHVYQHNDGGSDGGSSGGKPTAGERAGDRAVERIAKMRVTTNDGSTRPLRVEELGSLEAAAKALADGKKVTGLWADMVKAYGGPEQVLQMLKDAPNARQTWEERFGSRGSGVKSATDGSSKSVKLRYVPGKGLVKD
jgi:hypothetical protein